MNDEITDKRIDLLVTPGIMPLDVLKLRRVAEGGSIPVQLPEPRVQRRVSRPDVAQIALEVLHVHGVEAHDGRVQPNVRLRDFLAEVIWAWGRRQVFFDPVERAEELRDGFFVGRLRPAHAAIRYLRAANQQNKEWARAASYVAKPDLYTPLLISS